MGNGEQAQWVWDNAILPYKMMTRRNIGCCSFFYGSLGAVRFCKLVGCAGMASCAGAEMRIGKYNKNYGQKFNKLLKI